METCEEVVDFGESGPVRCSRCKGYINPFMKFIDQERKFICNLCGDREDLVDSRAVGVDGGMKSGGEDS
ncbi:hypothetical protein PVK06_004181 [Gossypium arboreum]|uniref:Zinc finger Sec23/Sec24-type domain-containing protein n=1 Tax=Gossypium arboreum TaxID=29729 RepID=A0ABR0QR99_GOSAR|nr:hypothetical protein PVK06_004181 [Gossypium arboreum]